MLAQVNGASLSETIAGGDGANDLQMIAAAGFGFAYHGKPVVMREAPRGVRFGDFSVLKHCFLEAWARRPCLPAPKKQNARRRILLRARSVRPEDQAAQNLWTRPRAKS